MGNFRFSALASVASLGAISAIAAPGESKAAVVINFQQVAADTIATTSGTLDLTGLSTDGFSGLSLAFINPGGAEFTSAAGNIQVYFGLTGPINFGTGGYTSGMGTGDAFGFVGFSAFERVKVPVGYVSGAPLAATTTFAGQTFASLGLTPGTYVFNVPADTITVQFGTPTAVPEPATWILMLLGFGAVGGTMRYRLRKTARLFG